MASMRGSRLIGGIMRPNRSWRRFAAAASALCLLLLLVVPSSASATSGPDTVDEIHASFGDVAATSMWVGWRGAAAVLNYGLDESYGQTATPVVNPVTPVDIAGPFQHVLLSGLTPDTVYHYQIDTGLDHQFKTAPSGDVTWDDIGDTGTTYNSFNAATGTGCNANWMASVWQQVADELPDFVSHGGDITYANECGQGAVHQFYEDIAPIATMRAWQQSWGNHEYGSPTSASPPGTPRDSMANYKGRLYLANPGTAPNDTAGQVSNPGCPSPSNASVNGCMGSDWGYYTVGHVLVIEYPETWPNAQTVWGTAADTLMAQAQADPNISFIVTTGHRPAYTSLGSAVDTTLKTAIDKLGDKYSPAAQAGGKYVLNIAHHVHGGEVFSPQHGVVQITNGGGGTEEANLLNPTAGSLFRTSHFEHLRVTATDSTMKIDMICGPVWPPQPTRDACTQGSVVYSTTLTAGSAPPPPPPPPPPTLKQWITNPGLDGGNKTGWTGVYNSSSRVSVTKDTAGNWRVQLNTTSTTAKIAGVNNPSPFWVNNASAAGKTYTATAQAMPSVTGEKVYILLRETTPGGTVVGHAQTATLTLTDVTKLTQLPQVQYKAARSGDSIRYSLIATNLSKAQALYGDNFSLTSPQ
jgi:hypothetical protein